MTRLALFLAASTLAAQGLTFSPQRAIVPGLNPGFTVWLVTDSASINVSGPEILRRAVEHGLVPQGFERATDLIGQAQRRTPGYLLLRGCEILGIAVDVGAGAKALATSIAADQRLQKIMIGGAVLSLACQLGVPLVTRYQTAVASGVQAALLTARGIAPQESAYFFALSNPQNEGAWIVRLQ